MSSLKPLLIIAVLGGIAYGVYYRMNARPEIPPAGAGDDWDSAPDVQMSDESSSLDPTAFDAPGGSFSGVADGAARNSTGRGNERPGMRPSHDAPPYDQPSRGAATGNSPRSGGAAPPIGADQGYSTSDPGFSDPTGYPDAVRPGEDPSRRPPYDGQRGAPDDGYAAGAGAGKFDRPSAAGNAPGGPADAQGFIAAIDGIRRQLDQGKMAQGLVELSKWYFDPQLSGNEQQQLNELLDQVAGTVVYSTQNWLEPPYEVQPGEQLDQIAERYEIPSQLLAKINGLADPRSVQPGDRLKVVRGPFDAVVSLDRHELTLWLHGSYAGRFACGMGRDFPAREGEYTVTEKNLKPAYVGANRSIPGDDASNPLGGYWIGLGGQVGIHGTNEPQYSGRTDLPGSINLGSHDIADVFDILSVGSKVVVRR